MALVKAPIVIAFFILLFLLFPASFQAPVPVSGTSTTPVVHRLFYFSGPPPSTLPSKDTLSPSRPPTGTPNKWNLSKTPVDFFLPCCLLSSLTISGPPSFTAWLSSNASTPVVVQVEGTFRWRPFGGAWSNSSTPILQCTVSTSPVPCSPIFDPTFGLSLSFETQVSVGINATVPAKTYVTLSWGEASTPSSVQLPMSGYATIGAVSILDWTGSAAASFNLNATKGQNAIIIAAPVTAALGIEDIRNVTLTIIDPSGRYVNGAANLTMSQFPPVTATQQTYPFVREWTYSSNLPEGNYEVGIEIVDSQGNIAFRLQGPYGFGLFKPGIHPLDLIPYVLIAGVGVGGGAFYYRRRKKKEYLSPFDHFYTLTAGSIPQGTMVTVEGNTGAGKTLLAEQLMYDDLKAGRPCVFVSTADFPMKIRGGIRSLGLEPEPYESKDALRFVDCYSAEAGQPSQEKFYVSSPGDLTSLGVKITSAISSPGEGPSVYFDSLTPLAPRSKPESIVSFAQTVGAKIRGLGGKAFFTVGSSLDESILRQLEESSDCIIQMEAFEEGGVLRRRMRITKFRNRRHHEGWVTFSIGEGKGILFYSKKPRK